MFKTLEIVTIGTYVHIISQDDPNPYVVLQTSTYQAETGQYVTYVTILEVTDEGDDAGKEPKTVKAHEIEEI